MFLLEAPEDNLILAFSSSEEPPTFLGSWPRITSPFLFQPPWSYHLLLSLTLILLLLSLSLLKTLGILSVSFKTLSLITYSSVTQSCLTLCDPMDCSTPGLPVHHQLPELAQTHVHQVRDAIQPSHSLSFPSPPAFNPSQHQGLFQ